MAKVEVDIYEKKHSHCSNCEAMRPVFEEWANDTTDTVTSWTFSAEDHVEELRDLGVQQAPVYLVRRDDKTSVISGYNPDILVDELNGDTGIWDDLDSDCAL